MSAAKTADTLAALTSEWRTTAAIADALGIDRTTMHGRLVRLENAGKVESTVQEPDGRTGRPAALWRLRAEEARAL